MRSTSFLAALLVAVALAALVVLRFRDPSSKAATAGTATLIGDPLDVGIEPSLSEALPRWRLVADDRAGRTTPEGVPGADRCVIWATIWRGGRPDDGFKAVRACVPGQAVAAR